MADCSYVNVTFRPEWSDPRWAKNLDRFHQWIERALDMFEGDEWDCATTRTESRWTHEGQVEKEVTLHANMSFYETAWGLHNDRIVAFKDRLRNAGIAYIASDGGHYTWNASEDGWEPGMIEEKTRTVGVEGGPVYVDLDDMNSALAAVGGDKAAAWDRVVARLDQGARPSTW